MLARAAKHFTLFKIDSDPRSHVISMNTLGIESKKRRSNQGGRGGPQDSKIRTDSHTHGEGAKMQELPDNRQKAEPQTRKGRIRSLKSRSNTSGLKLLLHRKL